MIGHIEEPGESAGLRADDRDELLVTLLGPGSQALAPDPGAFERIRAGATRRRRVRAAVGGGLALATAALVALPVLLIGAQATRTAPLPPLAPGPTISHSRGVSRPDPVVSPEPLRPTPLPPGVTRSPSAASGAGAPTADPMPRASAGSGAANSSASPVRGGGSGSGMATSSVSAAPGR